MVAQSEPIPEGQRVAISAIADDAMRVFRAGLFLIVIYLSILSLVLNTGGVEYIENIMNSFYTINGVVFWIGSLTLSIFTHRIARRVTLRDDYAQLGGLDDRWQLLNHITACTFGLLIAVFSLMFGLLEGWANTVSGTTSGIPINQPIGVIFLSLIAVFCLYGAVASLDMIREKWGPIRKILRLS